MECRDKAIKEMLPQYLAGELDLDVRSSVDGHLSVCGDCRAEMEVLSALSAETVPDPGEEFWAGMPGRVRRACLEEKKKSLREKLRPPMWAWAGGVAAAALAVLLALWPGGSVWNDTAVDQYSAAEYIYEYSDADAVSLKGLEGDELGALALWAGDELEAAGEEAAIALVDDTAGGFYEEFSDMDAQELESFSRMLDKAKQEV